MKLFTFILGKNDKPGPKIKGYEVRFFKLLRKK